MNLNSDLSKKAQEVIISSKIKKPNCRVLNFHNS